MTNTSLKDFKLHLCQYSPWLESMLESAETHARNALQSREHRHYEPLLFDAHLKDVSSTLDRCLANRREANELDIAATKAAADFELFLKLTRIDQALEINALATERLRGEATGYRRSSDAFGENVNSPLGKGFNLHDDTLCASANMEISAAEERRILLAERWELLQAFQQAYNQRHTTPGNSHNYAERMNRIKRILADDLILAYEKAQAISFGIATVFGKDLPVPSEQDDDLLDSLVYWARDAIQFLELESQDEVAYDLFIPLAQPWKPDRSPLVEPRTLYELLEDKSQPLKRIPFDLNGVFFNQSNLRLRAVGLSFGSDPEVSPGGGGQILDKRSYWRLRATIHLPNQPDPRSAGQFYARPPVILGNVSVYGRSMPVNPESTVSCHNVNPVGKWMIMLNALSVWATEEKADVSGGLFTRIVRDMKLLLRVVSKPARGEQSVFFPSIGSV